MFKEVGDFVGKYLKNSDVNEIEKQESLADRLFDLDLSEKNVAFIVEHGQDFVDYPGALAKRLSMKVSVAKDALDVLQAFKIKQISIEEIKRFELLVKENPLESPQQIALSYGIHRDIVSAYLAYSETNSLTELDKITIKEKYNDGFSITEIGNQFALSEKKIREYVENTFIFFYGKEGAKIFEILNKNFEEYPMMKLREMIITTNVKLQEKICCELPKRNERDYRDVKQYFLKFEESQNFFEIEETLSIEAKTRIRASSLDDIGELSIKLNRIERVIRNYLLQYYPDINLLIYLTQERLKQIQKIEANFGGDTQIPHTTYRMIISDSIDSLIKNAKSMEEKSLSKIFKELLPLAFYYIKCSLPLEELTRIIVSITNMSLTTLDIFHLIFQMSDSVVRGLCLEHYSFSNPVPFYYPILESHHREETSIRFEICKELWYSLQQFTGLVSFGLGWASWNPIGKSHLLDLVFETDFVKRSPQKSPFHLSSIDIQMTKNLFGRIKKTSNESTKWAYVDCHGCSDMKIIKDICQNLDIALIHVSYSDYVENFSRMEEDLNTITLNTKHVYVFVRDCAGAELTTKQVPISDRTSETYTFIFIPNLIEQDVKLLLALKKIGYMILHPTIASPRSVGSNFLENLITRYGSWDNLEREKVLVDNIKSHIHTNTQITATSNIEFSFLSYYPHFVEYMCCYYDALNETDQKIIDKLNEKCEQLSNHLENTEMNAIVWHFNDILAEENSTLILWKLSQEFKILSQRLVGVNKKTSYTLELLWREALLSSKYNETISDDKPGGNYPEMFSANFSNHVERGEPFELIDGDNLRFFNQDINVLLSNFYGNQFYEKSGTDGNKRPPIVVSIFGPQSSGKSTLLNYCFGCKFLTSAGRCTKGVYASLSKLSQPVNNSDHFLILDTEGLDAIEKGRAFQDSSCISFDRTMVLFCLAVSQVAIINVKGDLGEEMRNLLQICSYSLYKLKVNKVAAPKIFFVLNQQADPDPDKHLDSINTLLEKLNEESYLMETEGLKISDLIQVSKQNLSVLPSAFNSESLNTQMAKQFDSDLYKLTPTISFSIGCADLRISIIHQLIDDNKTDFSKMTHDYKMPFNTMSEWMEMSGVIWDTIVKYQDIVKYRNSDELKCSISLSKLVNDLMKNIIHFNKEKYREITERLVLTVKNIAEWSPPKVILEGVKKELDDVFNEYLEIALTDFAAQCQADSLLKRMDYMCDETKSNLCRLIYMEKKIYEDKLNLAIKARLSEIKLSESMMKFQDAIEQNADRFFELNIEEQTNEFGKVWIRCFDSDNKEEEEAELDEKFDNLYSVFRIESKTMENKQTILIRFRNLNFDMDTIVRLLGEEMFSLFCRGLDNFAGIDKFIYPWKENRVPIKEMTPYTGKVKCEYLNKESLFTTKYKKKRKNVIQIAKPNLNFLNWVPKECYPLIRYCSGYYNHPDIIWKLEKRKQIILLASQLKDPNNFERSTWDKFLNDISERVQEFIKRDPSISHSTVKEIVDFLCHISKVVNYEINFIEAKLTNAAERTISTYAFAFAFKSLLETKFEKQRENKSREIEKKEKNFIYFLQKVKNRKLTRGNWDRKEMRKGDQSIAHKFTGDFLAAVWRRVKTACVRSIKEDYFDENAHMLSHQSILLLANDKLTKELAFSPQPNIFIIPLSHRNELISENNFVVQFICNQIQTLKTVFQEEWRKVANELYHRIVENMKKIFMKQIAIVKSVLTEFLEGLEYMCAEKDRLHEVGTDSDSNFEVAEAAATQESASKSREGPFKAMVLFLEIYLNPKVSPEKFNSLFNGIFEVDSVQMKKHHDTYVLFEKPFNQAHVLDEDIFKMLTDTNMFRCTETIFNIKVYVLEFMRTLNCYKYHVTEAEYENILKATKEQFESHVINCPYQCPSCGKFCEREIHPHGGKCQIMTGHQLCSMGGNVWNTNKDRTAVLLMCEDYMDDTPVLTPGQNMRWSEFKEKCGDQWDWSLPKDEKYVALQRKNRDKMKNIWNKFGWEILRYYYNKGIHITYIPYTSPEEIYKSLFIPNYYVCFVIDGTNQKCVSFGSSYYKYYVSSSMKRYAYEGTANFRVIIYHGHGLDDQECTERFPYNSEFTSDDKSIEHFLQNISLFGEGSESAMLHGLASAATESDWKTGLGVKNIIDHLYVEPTDGHFDVFTARGNCNQGCRIDWKTNFTDKMDELKIGYDKQRHLNNTHPETFRRSIISRSLKTPNIVKESKPLTRISKRPLESLNSKSPTVPNLNPIKPKPQAKIYINYKTDK